MSVKLQEKLKRAEENVAKLRKQQRVEGRLEREANRKKEKQRCYIIGELVVKYFPEVSRFEPGTKAKNAVEFMPLEMFLQILADDEETVMYLKELAREKLPKENPSG